MSFNECCCIQDAEKSGCRRGFQCDSGICIDNQLVCDNVNHCGDGADERHSQFCSREFKFYSNDGSASRKS